MKTMAMLERQPVRTFLRGRETLVPRKKLVNLVGHAYGGGYKEPVPLPEGITAQQAVEVVARSSWATELAKGVCGQGYASLKEGSAEWYACIQNVSHRVASRSLGLDWPLKPTPAPRRRGR